MSQMLDNLQAPISLPMMAMTNGNSPAASIAASSGSDSTEQATLCHICSDRATGNHYGGIRRSQLNY